MGGLSAKTRLQRELLKKDVAWLWTEEHNKEFLAVREEVGDPNTLWHYDGEMDLGVSIDTQRTNGPNSEAVAGLGFVCFNYYRDKAKAEQTGLGGPLHPGYTGIKALQFGSIAAKDSWKSKPPQVSGSQGLKVSGSQGLKVSRSQGLKVSRSQGLGVSTVLELGLDDMENEEQKRLTKCAAWMWSRGRTGDFRRLVRALHQEPAWRQALQVEALPP